MDPDRRSSHYPSDRPLQLRCDSWGEFLDSYARDVRRGGMFIRTDEAPETLSSVEIRLRLPEGTEVAWSARVVHVITPEQAAASGRDAGMGVELVQLDAEQKHQIQQLVEFAERQQLEADPNASFTRALLENTPPMAASEVAVRLSGMPGSAAEVAAARRAKLSTQSMRAAVLDGQPAAEGGGSEQGRRRVVRGASVSLEGVFQGRGPSVASDVGARAVSARDAEDDRSSDGPEIRYDAGGRAARGEAGGERARSGSLGEDERAADARQQAAPPRRAVHRGLTDSLDLPGHPQEATPAPERTTARASVGEQTGPLGAAPARAQTGPLGAAPARGQTGPLDAAPARGQTGPLGAAPTRGQTGPLGAAPARGQTGPVGAPERGQTGPLGAAPARAQTGPLGAAPARGQTGPLGAAPARGQTGPLGAAPARGQAGPLGAAPARGQTGPLGAAPSRAQTGPLGAAPSRAQTGPLGAAPARGQTGPLGAAPARAQTGPLGAAPTRGQTGPLGAAPARGQTEPLGAAPSRGQTGPLGAAPARGQTGPLGAPARGQTGPLGAAPTRPQTGPVEDQRAPSAPLTVDASPSGRARAPSAPLRAPSRPLSGQPGSPSNPAGDPATPPQPTDVHRLKLVLNALTHKHYDDAARLAREMLIENPGDPQVLKWQAICFARLHLARGDENAAAEQYARALQYDENNREARDYVRTYARDQKLNSFPFGRYFTKKK